MQQSIILRETPHWRPVPPRLQLEKETSPLIASWILERGSLTRRLAEECAQDVRVELLQQLYQCALLPETRILGLRHPHLAVVREVALRASGVPMLLARSILPRETIVRADRRLWRLGEVPLGEILFNHPQLGRRSLEYARIRLRPGSFGIPGTEKIWGRRSVYTLGEDAPLLVAEFFLPSLL